MSEDDLRGRPPDWLALPANASSVKFAVIGDGGRGWPPQYDVAQRMAGYHQRFAFPLVLMVGDNIYEGPASPEDYRQKFEEPYRALREAGVRFQAVLGNHDDPAQRFYAGFNMDGQRFYSFEPSGPPLARLRDLVRIFALDSTNVDATQLAWLDRELGRSRALWKLCILHHPLYTAGRYERTGLLMRWHLESILITHGVHAVFSGHEHFYQRSTPQQGIVYFITGAAGSLRTGDASSGPTVARAFDRDYSFMLCEIVDDKLYFQSITRAGVTVDAGVVRLMLDA
ncbi:Calcineurin-like phosphoesterase [Luteitalea pratensis]|uniref:Calcineurin-like phosphoesterase n=1 Tax=Luteitalea pratensis TaxID=1855912 RepID=A0A143PKG4_LUTPR|nr:metallophosphoesterase [Luteitalea pratensis]AMY08249.1 Calcineurin-like phosphoesterase [Luteitalea pratensis]